MEALIWISAAIAVVATVCCIVACAMTVSLWRAVHSEAQKLRGMHSLAADLAELQDSVGKLSVLHKRINSRQVMQERRDRADSPESVEHLTLKDRLRLQAGLTAGRPAPHKP